MKSIKLHGTKKENARRQFFLFALIYAFRCQKERGHYLYTFIESLETLMKKDLAQFCGETKEIPIKDRSNRIHALLLPIIQTAARVLKFCNKILHCKGDFNSVMRCSDCELLTQEEKQLLQPMINIIYSSLTVDILCTDAVMVELMDKRNGLRTQARMIVNIIRNNFRKKMEFTPDAIQQIYKEQFPDGSEKTLSSTKLALHSKQLVVLQRMFILWTSIEKLEYPLSGIKFYN